MDLQCKAVHAGFRRAHSWRSVTYFPKQESSERGGVDFQTENRSSSPVWNQYHQLVPTMWFLILTQHHCCFASKLKVTENRMRGVLAFVRQTRMPVVCQGRCLDETWGSHDKTSARDDLNENQLPSFTLSYTLKAAERPCSGSASGSRAFHVVFLHID